MLLGLISNWGGTDCGVANFGRDWRRALRQAGHEVLCLSWELPHPPVDRILINWIAARSRTQPSPRIDGVCAPYLSWGSCGARRRDPALADQGGGTLLAIPISTIGHRRVP